MNSEESTDPKEPLNARKTPPPVRPDPSKMFDSSDPQFYREEPFQQVASEVMFPGARRKSLKLLKRFNIRAIPSGPGDVANEALRKTFEKFPNKIGELEDSASARREYFKNLLNRIVSNLTFSLIRASRSIKETPIEDDSEIPAPSEGRDILQNESNQPTRLLTEKLTKLKEAFAKLSPKDQELLHLRYNENKSFREIAELWGSSAGALKVRALRAREQLKRWLGD
jgi:RNA polymerase sigma-70 factor, ECF subfamily